MKEEVLRMKEEEALCRVVEDVMNRDTMHTEVEVKCKDMSEVCMEVDVECTDKRVKGMGMKKQGSHMKVVRMQEVLCKDNVEEVLRKGMVEEVLRMDMNVLNTEEEVEEMCRYVKMIHKNVIEIEIEI
jgi:hypothetical protein